ncbi:hypothetical protein EVG20_g4984 [Dentipellis fragilis]|uniref:Endonuclease/exonuclease/phosphatase domain-containing protein n=1 Tax=Dentipellis fragilis TaxID=205917 RepID=A0A4Y9YWK1_9AGAM|nr:hypothetical protein EVG20_g4984 [Dentipellis fragilis]
MFLDRLHRALSSFNHVTHRWQAIPLRDPHHPIPQRGSSHPGDAIGKQSLSLTSWNIQASQSEPVARSKLILDHILKGPKVPDVIHLQEVACSARQSLLDDPRVRSGFLTTDAEDDLSFRGIPFGAMTLLSSERFGSPLLDEKAVGGGKLMLDSVFCMKLPSRYSNRSDALCVDIAAPATSGAVFRLLNVHLDSLDSEFRRGLQMVALAGVLRESGCRGGIIAGDFDAIFPEDHKLVDEYELLAASVALHGRTGSDGAMWGVVMELEDGLKTGRLDKIAMLGLKPDEIEVLKPGLIAPGRPWSDHCGLRCTFNI